MPRLSQRRFAALLGLNLLIQALDGIATYTGLQAGYGEGNPILRAAMTELGTAPALFLFKLEACACLLLLWRLRRSWIAAPALALCAVVYLTFAIGPWAAALAQAHLGPYAAS